MNRHPSPIPAEGEGVQLPPGYAKYHTPDQVHESVAAIFALVMQPSGPPGPRYWSSKTGLSLRPPASSTSSAVPEGFVAGGVQPGFDRLYPKVTVGGGDHKVTTADSSSDEDAAPWGWITPGERPEGAEAAHERRKRQERATKIKDPETMGHSPEAWGMTGATFNALPEDDRINLLYMETRRRNYDPAQKIPAWRPRLRPSLTGETDEERPSAESRDITKVSPTLFTPAWAIVWNYAENLSREGGNQQQATEALRSAVERNREDAWAVAPHIGAMVAPDAFRSTLIATHGANAANALPTPMPSSSSSTEHGAWL